MSFTPPISEPIMPDCASLFISLRSLQSVHARIHLDNRRRSIEDFDFISQICDVLLPSRPESIHLTLLPHSVLADKACKIGPREHLIEEVHRLRKRLDGFSKIKITLMDNIYRRYNARWWSLRAQSASEDGDNDVMFDVQHSSGTRQIL